MCVCARQASQGGEAVRAARAGGGFGQGQGCCPAETGGGGGVRAAFPWRCGLVRESGNERARVCARAMRHRKSRPRPRGPTPGGPCGWSRGGSRLGALPHPQPGPVCSLRGAPTRACPSEGHLGAYRFPEAVLVRIAVGLGAEPGPEPCHPTSQVSRTGHREGTCVTGPRSPARQCTSQHGPQATRL